MSDLQDDNDKAVPVPESRLEHLYDTTAHIQADQVRRWRAVALDRRPYFWLSILLNIALACAFIMTLPNVQIVPIIMYKAADGWEFMSTVISDLPPNVEVASLEARLWTYLHDRESYNSIEADNYYAIVSAMSDTKVRNEYQNWANAQKNKSAPANILGRDGWIKTLRISSAFVTHAADYSYGVYRINYCKITHDGVSTSMRAVLESEIIQYHLTRRIPFVQRATFNPEALVVTAYPGPEDQDAMHDVNVGSQSPCGVH